MQKIYRKYYENNDVFLHSNGQYQCNHCEKQYKHLRSFMLHFENAHEGIKYKCNECEKEFVQKGGLVRHTQTMHASSFKYVCDYCDFQSSRTDRMKNHAKSHHNDQIDSWNWKKLEPREKKIDIKFSPFM